MLQPEANQAGRYLKDGFSPQQPLEMHLGADNDCFIVSKQVRVFSPLSTCCWVSDNRQKVNLFLYQLEMKQRYLVGKMNTPDERGDGAQEEVTMETLGEVTD